MSLEPDPYRLDIESLVLAPLAALYWAGWRCYEGWYALGLKRPYEPQLPTIVVGNLIVGGSGKSPTVLALVDLLRSLGRKVVVSASGYGSPRAQAATLAPQGELDAGEWGDEPAMLRWLRPDLPLIVGRRRVLAAQIAADKFPGHVMVMDDGFQHKPLKKHLSVLLDPDRVANAMCLPAGPYREPRSNRSRADFLIPDTLQISSAGTYFMDPSAQRVNLAPQPVQLVCAVARPYRLAGSLEAQGFETRRSKFLRDHDPMNAPNLMRGLSPELPVVVTAKDWMKLRRRTDLAGWRIWIAHYDVEFQDRDRFAAELDRRLNEIQI